MSETPYGKQPSFSRLDPKYFYPQNFPSVVVGHVLDPEPDDHILDMCAAPGINFYLLGESKSYIYICTFLTKAGTKNQENAFKNVQKGLEFPKLSEIVLEALVYTSADSYYSVRIKTWMRK